MRPKSNPDRTRSGAKLLALSLLAAGGVIVVASLLTGDFESPVPTPEGGAVGPRGLPAPTPEYEVASEITATDPRVQEAAPGDSPQLVSCTQKVNGQALPGVRLYQGSGPEAESIAGPSDSEGALEIETTRPGYQTLWAQGWRPVGVRGEALPAEVAFEVANASLEVRLLNFTSGHRLLRSVLEPRALGTRSKGPWTPMLEERAADLSVADRIPPGSYDVYLWVVYPNGEPRPFSRVAFEVAGGRPTLLTIDLAAPQDPDELDSDG